MLYYAKNYIFFVKFSSNFLYCIFENHGIHRDLLKELVNAQFMDISIET